MLDHVPHAKAVGLTIVSVERGIAVLKLPYDDKLIGNPDTGVVHGGVITTLLDNCCGIAVGSSLDTFRPIATLDLRIDYMKPATPKLDILARAECSTPPSCGRKRRAERWSCWNARGPKAPKSICNS